MTDSPNIAEIESALRNVFPGAVIAVRRPSSGPGYIADVRLNGESVLFEIELLKSSSRAALRDAVDFAGVREDGDSHRIRLLAAQYFSNESQEFLRNTATHFLDFSGNAWVESPGLHIDRRGFANVHPERRDERDIYSDKASIVLRILLEASESLGVRQLSEISAGGGDVSRLSPGYVSKIIAELERRGYLSRRADGISLRHPEELLQEWIVSYKNRSKPSSTSYYIHEPAIDKLMSRVSDSLVTQKVDYVFTGHAGASQVDRFAEFDALDIYVRDEAAAARALTSLGARAVDRGGNVSVATPYYKISAFFGARTPKDSIRVASDLQLYLDLFNYPVRGREQAEHLFERRLRPRIERIGGIHEVD